MKTTLLLVDDHSVVRSGIRLLIEATPEITVVGEFGNGHEALALCDQLKPDIVLTDVDMPGLNGIELAKLLRDAHPTTAVIMLSMHRGREYVRQSLLAGARGYVLKDSALAELLQAIQVVIAGNCYVSTEFADLIVNGEVSKDAVEHSTNELDELSPREREILQLLSEGDTSKEIHAALHISERTVDTHRWNIMYKLNIRSMAGLTRFAIRHGLTSVNYKSGREGTESTKLS